MPGSKNILVCPLNWGLGHASRCIPVIKILLENHHKVTVAAGKNVVCFLKRVFPDISYLFFDDYKIKYNKKGRIISKLIIKSPIIFFRILKEHYVLKKLIKKHHFDVIISDNRFGLWNKSVKSIYITHQLFIRTSSNNNFLENIAKKIHWYFIKKYDVCWIPDIIGENNLAGELSAKEKPPANAVFIGFLSSFESSIEANIEYDICAVISGPEPQRTIFEKILLHQLKSIDKKSVVVLGKAWEEPQVIQKENITIYNFLSPKEVSELWKRSKIIIARSGYTTIMDLALTGKKAILVPTPGQTEQEYLAKYYSERKIFLEMHQDALNIETALDEIEKYSGIKISQDKEIQKQIILQSIDNNL